MKAIARLHYVKPQRVYDVHSHIDPQHIGAETLRNILKYHYLVTEMCTVGAPIEALNSPAPDPEWMAVYLAYLPKIRNTSSCFMARMILDDLYGLDIDQLSPANWKDYDARIRSQYSDPLWPMRIVQDHCKLGKLVTACRLDPKSAKPVRDLFLEEDENLADFGANEGANMLDELRQALGKADISAAAIRRHLRNKVDRRIEEGVAAFGLWMGRFVFEDVADADLDNLLGNNPDPVVLRRKLASFQVREILNHVAGKSNPPVARFTIGAHAAPGLSNKWPGRIFDMASSDIFYSYQKLFDEYPNLRISVFVSNSARSRELDNIARFHPNVSVMGCWLHTMFANQIIRIMSDRLEYLPTGKVIGFFSDAYNIEWIYGKLALTRRCLEKVIEQKVEEGWWTDSIARSVTDTIFWDNPARVYGS